MNDSNVRVQADCEWFLQLQLEIERKLRGLLTKDKQKAEEEAALAIGLCRSIP